MPAALRRARGECCAGAAVLQVGSARCEDRGQRCTREPSRCRGEGDGGRTPQAAGSGGGSGSGSSRCAGRRHRACYHCKHPASCQGARSRVPRPGRPVVSLAWRREGCPGGCRSRTTVHARGRCPPIAGVGLQRGHLGACQRGHLKCREQQAFPSARSIAAPSIAIEDCSVVRLPCSSCLARTATARALQLAFPGRDKTHLHALTDLASPTASSSQPPVSQQRTRRPPVAAAAACRTGTGWEHLPPASRRNGAVCQAAARGGPGRRGGARRVGHHVSAAALPAPACLLRARGRPPAASLTCLPAHSPTAWRHCPQLPPAEEGCAGAGGDGGGRPLPSRHDPPVSLGAAGPNCWLVPGAQCAQRRPAARPACSAAPRRRGAAPAAPPAGCLARTR